MQLLLFALVVCWPIWKTGRLSYVGIGWPWGLVCIGVLTLIFSGGYALKHDRNRYSLDIQSTRI